MHHTIHNLFNYVPKLALSKSSQKDGSSLIQSPSSSIGEKGLPIKKKIKMTLHVDSLSQIKSSVHTNSSASAQKPPNWWISFKEVQNPYVPLQSHDPERWYTHFKPLYASSVKLSTLWPTGVILVLPLTGLNTTQKRSHFWLFPHCLKGNQIFSSPSLLADFTTNRKPSCLAWESL